MLAKYVDIKVIGLSTPGIIRGDQIISMSIKGLRENFKLLMILL